MSSMQEDATKMRDGGGGGGGGGEEEGSKIVVSSRNLEKTGGMDEEVKRRK